MDLKDIFAIIIADHSFLNEYTTSKVRSRIAVAMDGERIFEFQNRRQSFPDSNSQGLSTKISSNLTTDSNLVSVFDRISATAPSASTVTDQEVSLFSQEISFPSGTNTYHSTKDDSATTGSGHHEPFEPLSTVMEQLHQPVVENLFESDELSDGTTNKTRRNTRSRHQTNGIHADNLLESNLCRRSKMTKDLSQKMKYQTITEKVKHRNRKAPTRFIPYRCIPLSASF